MRFASAILPPWCRKSPKISEVLPLLYLHGVSSKNFVPALEQFLGSRAGLSASAITRLTEEWQEEHRRRCEKDPSGADYVYVWADGLHFGVRLDQDRMCTLMVIGVRADGCGCRAAWSFSMYSGEKYTRPHRQSLGTVQKLITKPGSSG
jgi:putative transposase